MYIPSGVVVVLSWLTLYIDMEKDNQVGVARTHPRTIFSSYMYREFYCRMQRVCQYLHGSVGICLHATHVETFPFCHAQINLVVLLLLTIVTLSLGAQGSLPQVSYTKAVDVWMFACLANVCANLGVTAAGEDAAAKPKLRI